MDTDEAFCIATKTVTIAKDGSTEIIYDYDRELIALTLEDAEDTNSSLPAMSEL